MSETEKIRVCNLNHAYCFILTHKNERLFPTIRILVCDTCAEKHPYDKIKTREPLNK